MADVQPLLPLGSVVVLNNGTSKLMIVGRLPLYRESTEVLGYFDYLAALYPVGMTEDKVAYFNAEDIETVLFEGYVDESDQVLQNTYLAAMAGAGVPYRHLDISAIRG
ncbi:MAG: DUF4176 domain-containing protein [Actinomyces sp.]|nr:DUF4176 domain-containing protein [Actinomyces sp.]MDN6567116.1 DUF4176 domain-containing protein [Actinomyces sp.]MDN6795319.1 DUF4176 domain-containing protein [Propionibacterium sp.]